MSTRSMLLVTLAAALSVAACREAAMEAASLSEQDEAAIQAVSDAFVEAIVAGDVDSVAALYTEDAVFMPPGHPPVRGRAAIREFLAGFPPVESLELRNDEIEGRLDLAYVRGTLIMTLMPEGASEAMVDTGKYIEIRKRQPDGSWPLAVDIFNSSRSPEATSSESDM